MKHYCVIGYPIGHSLSPKIHNRWFRQAKIPARYEAIEVEPKELGRFMRNFRERFAGANVTIPHKERVIRYLDALSPEARQIGAVNTIVNRHGKFIGCNTDVFGAMEALKNVKHGTQNVKRFCGLRGKRAVVIGAGGAARAIVYGLKRAGARVLIVNRTLSRAKKLAKEFGCEFGRLQDFSHGAHGRSDCDILINATSVGMWPNTKETPLPSLPQIFKARVFSRGSAGCAPTRVPLVMDIVYRPCMTRFLRDAKRAGCRIITGDNMFLAQAAKSFELWTGFIPQH